MKRSLYTKSFTILQLYEKIATSYIQVGSSKSAKFFAKIQSF